MAELRLLEEFFESIHEDPRIAPVHVCLYTSLFLQWIKNDGKNPVIMHREKIMALSKIMARGTFYRTINELEEVGFIKYIPSSNQFGDCTVYLIDLERRMREYQFRG